MGVAVVHHQANVRAVDVLVLVRDLRWNRISKRPSAQKKGRRTHRANVEVLAMARDRAPRVVSDQALHDVLLISALLVELLHELLQLLLRCNRVDAANDCQVSLCVPIKSTRATEERTPGQRWSRAP